MSGKRQRRPKTFTVSRARAFVGSVLGDDLGSHSPDELERKVQHMEGHFAETEEDEKTPGLQSPEE